MRKLLTFILAIMLTADIAMAQRKTDVLDRGLVAVPLADNSSIGNFLSWRIQADEYYGMYIEMAHDLIVHLCQCPTILMHQVQAQAHTRWLP